MGRLITPMGQPRYEHACGVYQDADDQQVLIVTGGWDAHNNSVSSTEVAIYTGGGSQLEWREVETGRLPTPRRGLRAAVIENHIYATGGYDRDGHNGRDGGKDLTEILRWDPST